MFCNTVRRIFVPALSLLLCSLMFQGCQTKAQDRPDAIRVLMVGGGSSHDFDKWYKGTDVQILRDNGLATVRYTSHPDSIDDYLPDTDVLYLVNNQPVSDPAVRDAIFDFVDSGNGLVLGHAALWYNWSDWPGYNRQLVSGGSKNHDPYGDFQVTVTDTDHDIMRGIPSTFTVKDELYHFNVDPAAAGITVLATAGTAAHGDTYPSVFIVKHDKARIAAIALGHDGETHNLQAYRNLLRNAVRWVAR